MGIKKMDIWLKYQGTTFSAKLDPNTPLYTLKSRIEMITGCSSNNMKFQMLKAGSTVQVNDSNSLASLNTDELILSGTCLTAQDVKKFELTDEEYEKRPDTLRSWLANNNLLPKTAQETEIGFKVNDRCSVNVDGLEKKGTIMYIGPLVGKSGTFIGVAYDEPLGLHDGSLQGKRYFECKLKCGAFVSPLKIKILTGDEALEDDPFDQEQE